MTPRRLAIVFTVLGLAAWPAHADAQNREQLQMNADIRQLQEQVGKLQLTVNQLVAQLSDQIKAINKKLDDQADANTKAFADERLQLTSDATTLTALRNRVDENTSRVAQTVNEIGALRDTVTHITQQLNTLTNLIQPSPVPGVAADASGSGAPAGAPPSGQTGPLGAVPPPDSPTACYQRAEGDYMANHLDSAVEGFQDCLTRFPGMANGDDATFFMGEALRQQGKYQDAVKAYQKVITDYKTSRNVPDAYYNEGVAYLAMNQKPNAQRTFNQLIGAFPGSTQATMAQQQLQRLGTSKN